MRKQSFRDAFFGFWRNVRRFFKSRLGVASLGIVAISFAVLLAYQGVRIIRFEQDPLSAYPSEAQSLHRGVMANGTEFDDHLGLNLLPITKTKAIKRTYAGQEYAYCVPDDRHSADIACVSATYVNDVYSIQIGFSTANAIGRPEGVDNLFYAKVAIYDTKTNRRFLKDGIENDNFFVYQVTSAVDMELVSPQYTWCPERLTPEEYDGALAKGRTEAHNMFVALPSILEAFGVSDGTAYLNFLIGAGETRNAETARTIYFALSWFFGAPIIALFVILWIRLLVEDRRIRLISRGVVERKSTTTAETLSISAEAPPSEVEASAEEEEETPVARERRRVEKVEDWLARKNIRPIFGEWVFRGIGLGLVFIGAILSSLAAFFLAGDAGQTTQITSYFDSIRQLGAFVLVISVITIISETRRNLSITASAFLGLAFVFYGLACALWLFLSLFTGLGAEFISVLAQGTGGNVLLGLGIFAITGFFLFENPPKWFINRKVFRSLAAIPVLLTIASLVASYLFQVFRITIPFWLSGLLFLRDFPSLVIGLIMEFAIFLFRTRLKRVYGEENVSAQMSRPVVQFTKNLILCGLILFFTVVFYILPSPVRISLQMGKHTFVYLMIPFFLFFKPAGENHKFKSDIIYYILYVICMAVPILSSSLTNFIMGL
ncbi:MAG: hypothetical protein E7182_01010 [Erysipelotrichaceae bacterium]|nr:hypothetical protein [Erysipelotrichaceae bacterium]